ncbi:MAG: bis(5'-nucleosyl)-tetraphosphatase (symmetrical) YqeK [Bacilli bacterium]
MEWETWSNEVKCRLKPKRWTHTLGVVQEAERLALHYGVDVEKARIAALVHDAAKCLSLEEQRRLIEREGEHTYVLKHNKEIWHGFAAVPLMSEWGITDLDIVDAVRYHTSGRLNMPLLTKVIYIADYIEPNRNFPGVEVARELAYRNLDESILFALKRTIGYLVDQDATIFPLTVETYNEYANKKKKG